MESDFVHLIQRLELRTMTAYHILWNILFSLVLMSTHSRGFWTCLPTNAWLLGRMLGLVRKIWANTVDLLQICLFTII